MPGVLDHSTLGGGLCLDETKHAAARRQEIHVHVAEKITFLYSGGHKPYTSRSEESAVYSLGLGTVD